ncbi:unnamed protein product [Musa banksii]
MEERVDGGGNVPLWTVAEALPKTSWKPPVTSSVDVWELDLRPIDAFHIDLLPHASQQALVSVAPLGRRLRRWFFKINLPYHRAFYLMRTQTDCSPLNDICNSAIISPDHRELLTHPRNYVL